MASASSSGRAAATEDYRTDCELNECQWEYKRVGTSQWEPFNPKQQEVIETARVLREDRAQITIGEGYGYASRAIINLKDRTFSRAYGGNYEIRRLLLYSKDEIQARKNRKSVKDFMANKKAKAFADQLFDNFKNEPDSDDEDGEEDEVIEDNLADFCTHIGVDPTSIQPAIVFFFMNVKGFMEVSRHELYLFLHCCGARNIATLKSTTARLTGLIAGDSEFATFYMWNFMYYRKAQEEAKKYIPTKTAAQVWAQILVPRYPEILKHLGAFMAQYKAIGISMDTWKMLLDFCKNTKPDLSDMADFYPPFVDEYVDFLVENHGFKNPNAEENEDDDDDFF